MTETKRIAIATLETLVARAFLMSATSAGNAAAVAQALVAAEIDGQKGHGLSRVASYAAQSRSGKVDGHAVPSAQIRRPGALMIDAGNGFAYPALALARERLPQMARASGIAAAGIVRSHHFGVAGWHVEQLCEHGLVAVILGNTPQAMASWGGRRPVFGTNPLAFAAPLRAAPPIVIDLAMSQVARGKIVTAAGKGEAIPEGWALDSEGVPTTDPKAALAGTLLPLGGAKGSALALMVEVLAAALTGANLAFEASSFFDAAGPPPGVGQLLLAIDPAAFGGEDTYLDRIAVLAAAIEGDEGARLPGRRRIALREAAQRDGVPIEADMLAGLEKLAAG